MSFDPFVASRRFGSGPSPRLSLPASVSDLTNELHSVAADVLPDTFMVEPYGALIPIIQRERELRRTLHQAREKGVDVDAATAALRRHRRQTRLRLASNLPHALIRAAGAPFGLRERLIRFWADHFTVRSKQGFMRYAVENYVEAAIRPNITGNFSALLRAAILDPMMLAYLDQNRSIGPNSAVARRRNRGGLNENLARELLELHTLGVAGEYSQNDVRQLAELLTGLTVDTRSGARFRPALAEPGAETIFGRIWGGQRAELSDIHDFLGHLATRDDTARHIATKLCVHFISDTPDPGLIAEVSDVWRATGGALIPVYEALLLHPAAMAPEAQKARQPFDFMVSCLRALDVDSTRLTGLSARDFRNFLETPLALMGQPWGQAPGPDGWPEVSDAWITARALAERVNWAMTAPRALRPDLPDPRTLAMLVSGETTQATGALGFAARSAATRWEGTGLVLASPVMQWR